MISVFEYDDVIFAQGVAPFCGVDEAGRGPIAGPVYAAAVILPRNVTLDGLADSKKLTDKKREALFDKIKEAATAWFIATASVKEIESINILNAAMLAMHRAVCGLTTQPALVLVDGNTSPQTNLPERLIVGGDNTSACIAAASVLAKVARDRHMLELAEKFPQYGFEKHKGYGTKLHYSALDEYGPCDIHRESFLKKWRAKG